MYISCTLELHSDTRDRWAYRLSSEDYDRVLAKVEGIGVTNDAMVSLATPIIGIYEDANVSSGGAIVTFLGFLVMYLTIFI